MNQVTLKLGHIFVSSVNPKGENVHNTHTSVFCTLRYPIAESNLWKPRQNVVRVGDTQHHKCLLPSVRGWAARGAGLCLEMAPAYAEHYITVLLKT